MLQLSVATCYFSEYTKPIKQTLLKHKQHIKKGQVHCIRYDRVWLNVGELQEPNSKYLVAELNYSKNKFIAILKNIKTEFVY